MRKAPRQFIAVDGEGVTEPDGRHHYVLLSCGDKHLSNDGAHLEFTEIMAFLYACFLENPRAAFVGFYLKYDFAQWLKTLPENRARALLAPEIIAKRQRTAARHLPPWPVTHYGWDFDYLPGKRFKLRPHHAPPVKGERRRKPPPWMYVNDAGSYFQCSFLKAINPEGNPNPVVTPEEYALIAEGKRRRSRAEFDPRMVAYNQLECTVLARLMAQLSEGMREEQIEPRKDQWHGPGQLAQIWLKKIEAPAGETLRAIVPDTVRDAARQSYFGGWTENFWHGPVPGDSYSYDVNSAYPYIMSRLPCLLHGKWVLTPEPEGGRRILDRSRLRLPEWGLVRAALIGTNRIVGAMLHRMENRAILRPLQTEGWFWAAELAASCRAGFVKELRIYETWHYQACDCPPPLAAIADLYQGRIRIGKNSPAGMARRLIYNACAGKFQQSVGEPVFGNPVYAAAITAGCRAMMADAIAAHPRGAAALLKVATDSVTFQTPHDGLELDPQKLGAWSETRHENLSLFLPGVYWDDKSRARIAKGADPVFKSRGIAAKDLARQLKRLDRAWQNFARGGWPELTIPVSFQFVSPKQALQRGKWQLCGKVIADDSPETWPRPDRAPIRKVSAAPGHKRQASQPGRSRPFIAAPNRLSLPYDGTFGDELREFAESEFGDNPDGPISGMLAEAVLG